MADRSCLRPASVVWGALVVAVGISACTQSMPVPAKTSATPTSSGTSAPSSDNTTPASTAAIPTDTATTTESSPTSSTDSSATTSASDTTSPTSSSTPTTTTTQSGTAASAPKVVVGESVLTETGPVTCTEDSNGTRTIEVGSGTVYTAQVTSDEDFSVVQMDLGVVDGVPMQVGVDGGSISTQERKSEKSYSIEGTAQGTDPSTMELVEKQFTFEATCP